MPLQRSRADLLSAAFALVAGAIGLAVWPRLPAEVAIHFSAGGTPDNYAPKAVAVVLLPALTLGLLVFVRFAERADPTADPRTVGGILVATSALLAAVHGLVLAFNLGYAVPWSAVTAGILLWAALVVGYAYRRESGRLGV